MSSDVRSLQIEEFFEMVAGLPLTIYQVLDPMLVHIIWHICYDDIIRCQDKIIGQT